VGKPGLPELSGLAASEGGGLRYGARSGGKRTAWRRYWLGFRWPGGGVLPLLIILCGRLPMRAAGKPEHPAQGATSGPRSGSEEETGVADR